MPDNNYSIFLWFLYDTEGVHFYENSCFGKSSKNTQYARKSPTNNYPILWSGAGHPMSARMGWPIHNHYVCIDLKKDYSHIVCVWFLKQPQRSIQKVGQWVSHRHPVQCSDSARPGFLYIPIPAPRSGVARPRDWDRNI